MYEAFYGLKERPFNLTPDPKYLYLSDKHKEAFAHLLFGIKNRSGFVMVTGEIGTGKTTICRNLLNQIDPDTKIAFIFNPPLNPVELLKKINVEFGISHAPDNVLELTEILNKFLLEQAAQSQSCVLVIDEAQNLSPLVLEQTRLLSNLETEKDKLLQIVLIGQPELGEKLALHELRQLNQRITARYHLKALSEHETLQYIAYRLHVAGGRRKIQFTKGAVKAVYRASGGTPRVINALCDRALLIGYTKEAVNLSAAIIRQAAKEIRGEKVAVERPFTTLLRQLLPNPSVALIAAVALFGIWYLGQKVGVTGEAVKQFNEAVLPPPAPKAPSNAVEAKAEPAVSTVADDAKRQEEIRAAVAKALAEKISPGVTNVAPASDPAKPLNDALSAVAPEAVLPAAAEALLHAWAVVPAGPALAEASPDAVAGYFQRQGFSVEKLMPGAEQLITMNLPAMVRVKQGAKEFWLTLVAAKSDGVTLAVAKDKTVSVPLAAFKGAYLAEAIVPWKDPDPRAIAMAVGRGGKPVADLKEQLRALGRLDAANKSDQYDQDTARAISRIQAETGLTIDGVAGRQLRMIMTAWAKSPGTPRLDGPAVAAAPPEKTAAAAPPPAPPASAAPTPVPAPKAASKKREAKPATTPLPTSEQLGKALEEKKAEKPVAAAPKVEVPKPDAPKTEPPKLDAPAPLVSAEPLPKPVETPAAPAAPPAQQ